MLRYLAILCALAATASAGRTLVATNAPQSSGVVVREVTPAGMVLYVDGGGVSKAARIAGIAVPATGSAASRTFVLFANYMARQGHCTIVPKPSRTSSNEVQVLLPDGRDLGYLLILGGYAETAQLPPPPPLYMTAKKALKEDAIEVLGARQHP